MAFNTPPSMERLASDFLLDAALADIEMGYAVDAANLDWYLKACEQKRNAEDLVAALTGPAPTESEMK